MQGSSRFTGILLLLISISVNAQQISTVDYYIAVAKENSPVLNDYNSQRYSLKIDSLMVLSDYGVKVTGICDAMYAPVADGWGYDAVLSNGQNVTAVIRASRDLLGKEDLKARLANYSLRIEQSENRSQITEFQLERAITEQYVNTYASQQRYLDSQEIVALLQQEDSILKKLTQNATFKQTDYLSFKVTLQQHRLASQQLHADWLNDYATLNYLAGIVDTAVQAIEPPSVPRANTLPFEQSVYAKSYETDSLKLANDARIIRYEYNPKLSLYADGGYSSSFMTSPYKNLGASIGLSLTIPIYDGNRRKRLLQQNRLQQETQRRYNEFRRNQYSQLALQIEAQIGEYKRMVADAGEQLKYARVLIDADLKQLPAGDVRVTDLVLSIENYMNLKSGLIQFEATLYDLYVRQNNLMLQ
jgi:outer membrane protein TolC